MDETKTPINYSVEIISQLRAQKKQELRDSKERIQRLTEDLFAPQQSKNQMENIMQHVNAGIAAYDGLRTGIMIFQRIHRFLTERKDKITDENSITYCCACHMQCGRSCRKSVMDALLLHLSRWQHHCILL